MLQLVKQLAVIRTDAINGSQLYSVAQVLSKLGIDVLGAAKADTNGEGFKKSKFNQLIGGSVTSTSPQQEKTFKKAYRR